MKHGEDRYNLDEVIHACAAHAWKTHRQELEGKRGIHSEAQLRQEIARAVHHTEARAYSAHYRPDPEKPLADHHFPREVYDLRPLSETKQDLGITVVLNPNRDPETGKLYGGTCVIRPTDKFFEKDLREEERHKGISREAFLIIGGYLALREQDRHRQLVVTHDKQRSPSPATPERVDWSRYIEDDDYRRTIQTQREKERPAVERQRGNGGWER